MANGGRIGNKSGKTSTAADFTWGKVVLHKHYVDPQDDTPRRTGPERQLLTHLADDPQGTPGEKKAVPRSSFNREQPWRSSRE